MDQPGTMRVLLNNYLSYLFRMRKAIMAFGLLGLVAGVSYAYLAKPKYFSRLVFLINESKSLSANPLSALAGQFGLSQTAPSATEDRVFYLAFTKKILGDALLMKTSGDMTIADKMIAIGNMKDGWKKDTVLADFDRFHASKVEQLSFAENKVMEGLINGIILSNKLGVESYKKKTSSFVGSTNSGIMTITYEATNEALARDFPIAIYERLSEFYAGAVTKSLQKNFDMLDQRADSLKSVLFDLEGQTANALDAGFNVVKYKGRIQENRLKRELEILNLIYAEVVKNREIARFNLDQEKPVFQLIDQPMFPLEMRTKSLPVFGLLGLLGAVFAGLLLFTLMFVRSNAVLSRITSSL